MNIIINLIIGFICICVLCLVVLNYYRIEKIVNEQKSYLIQSKNEIDELNVLLIRKYEKKKEVDVQILSLLNKKITSFERYCKDKSNETDNEMTNLKKNLKFLEDQSNIYNTITRNTITRNTMNSDVQPTPDVVVQQSSPEEIVQ
jgi:hypothetical protein